MMVDGGGGTAFPVVFFDGEREMDIGFVNINPTLEYKPFQHMLSQKIGISPNQISIYFLERKRNPKSPFHDERRRIPITGKVNFGLICRMKDCYFLAVLKRSRKSRNRRDRMMNAAEFADYLPNNQFPPSSMHPAGDNLILLRRDQPMPFYDQIAPAEMDDLNDRLYNLRVHRENYEMAMARGSSNSPNIGFDPNLNLNIDSFPVLGDSYGVPAATTMMMTNNRAPKAWCEGCAKANKDPDGTSFHPCINDAVITRFTPRAGPINRPNKRLP